VAISDKTWDDVAQDALTHVQRDPREAIRIGQSVIAATVSGNLLASRAVAERAVGLAYRELNDLPAAVRHLRRSVRTAQAAGSADLTALSRMSLGYALANSGRNVAALRVVTLALGRLTGVDAGRARMQRGVVLHYCGRYDEAARDYTVAVEIAQQEGDALLEARARNNRGLVQTHRGMARGGDDLRRAEEIFAELGLDLAAADTRWNLGTAAARRGDAAVALRTFAEVEQRYRELAVPRPALSLDRLELLLSIPLIDEAVELAAAAVHDLEQRDMPSDLAEALLGQARAALLAGDPDTATAVAARARAAFGRQGRRAWVALARAVELQADHRRGTRTAAMVTAMVRNAALLDETGRPGPALTARVDAARVAAAIGRPGTARDLLAVAAKARRGGTAARRAHGWYAAALLHRLNGDERRALTALRRGLTVLDAHRASLGATELRASSGAHGRDLALEGLDIAIGTGRPAVVLAWAEQWRAAALRMAPVTPPADPQLADALAELRMVSAAADGAALAGRPVQAQRRRQTQLEQRIRELTRHADGGTGITRPPGVRELADALGRSVLVEYVSHQDTLLAVVLRDGHTTLHDLGPLDVVLRGLRQHRFALRRLVSLADSATALHTARSTATALDERLLRPLADRIGTGPLVIAPIGALQALAWSALPTCAGRPVTVVPSAAAWLRATGQAVPDGPPVLVAGPRLPAAEAEIRALAHPATTVHSGATVLSGGDATAAAVTAAMNGSRSVHLAAHGVFRGDNPLLSTLELADGPLTAYELERLPRAPGRVILSACDAGLSGVRPGDELLGFGAVLLGAGTRTLVAGIMGVPADRTADLMLSLHRRLDQGFGPARALADAQLALAREGDSLSYATAAAFVCVGAL
jgi:CHAT domain-containing protein/tetratricopeptide (TPR) repeat protein